MQLKRKNMVHKNNLPPNLPALKAGWSWVKLGDVCEILDNKRIPINSRDRAKRIAGKPIDSLFPYFGATGQVGYIDDFLLDGEYVLLGEDGAPFLERNKPKAYIVKGKIWVNNHAHILLSKTNNKFLCYYLNFIEYHSFVTGTTRLKLNQTLMKQIPIINPPFSEQKKIVKKIEKLFAELDNGVASLKKAKEQIKLYRQSVLSAAFSGRLVGDAANPIANCRDKSRLVPTEEMSNVRNNLMRDRQAVENKHLPYKQEVKIAAEAKITYKDNGLPKGWKWVKFLDFCKLQRGYDLPLKNIIKGKYPVITSSGIKGYNNEYRAKGPCLITGRSGGVGNIHFLKVDEYWPHNTVLFVKDFCNNDPEYMYYFFRQFNFKSFSASTAVPTLDRKQLYNELVKVPPFEEQTKIVEEIEKRFSEADNIEKTIDESLKKAETLRQSILKKAFEGRLV